MYEHKKQQLAPIHVYRKRLKINALIAFIILIISLFIGMLGYKLTIPEFDWYDSLLNASMILSGMGPVVESSIVLTKTAKVFASIYAIFSGVTFLSTFGIFLTPVLHRFFHKLHLEENE
jgi:hypothetical protein